MADDPPDITPTICACPCGGKHIEGSTEQLMCIAQHLMRAFSMTPTGMMQQYTSTPPSRSQLAGVITCTSRNVRLQYHDAQGLHHPIDLQPSTEPSFIPLPFWFTRFPQTTWHDTGPYPESAGTSKMMTYRASPPEGAEPPPTHKPFEFARVVHAAGLICVHQGRRTLTHNHIITAMVLVHPEAPDAYSMAAASTMQKEYGGGPIMIGEQQRITQIRKRIIDITHLRCSLRIAADVLGIITCFDRVPRITPTNPCHQILCGVRGIKQHAKAQSRDLLLALRIIDPRLHIDEDELAQDPRAFAVDTTSLEWIAIFPIQPKDAIARASFATWVAIHRALCARDRQKMD